MMSNRSMHQAAYLCSAALASAASIRAQTVPAGFTVELIQPITDVSADIAIVATEDPSFGIGVLVGALEAEDFVLTLIDDTGAVTEVARQAGTVEEPAFRGIQFLEFDREAQFNGNLVSVWWEDTSGQNGSSTGVVIEPNGVITDLFADFPNPTYPSDGNDLTFAALITDDAGGFIPGLYLLDNDAAEDEPIYHYDPATQTLSMLVADRPPNGDNSGVVCVLRDRTGVYANRVLAVDVNSDRVWELSSSLQWTPFTAPLPSEDLRAFAMSEGGHLGTRAFLGGFSSGNILTLNTDGSVSPFASGFGQVWQLSASPSGRSLYVLSTVGIHVIRSGCRADLNGDLGADVFDFGVFAAAFGDAGLPSFSGGDLDGDGDVDVFDFGILAGDFGCGP